MALRSNISAHSSQAAREITGVRYRLTDQYVQRYRYKYQYMYVRVHVYGNAYPEYQNLYIRVYERRMCIQVLVRAAAEARPIQYYSSMLTSWLSACGSQLTKVDATVTLDATQVAFAAERRR